MGITGIDECSFEIPILPDIYGKTVLDYCLGIDSEPISDIFKEKKRTAEKLQKLSNSENKPMAELILREIKNYGFMHSSFFIT